MASLKVIAAGYEAELDIPDDDQVMDELRFDAMDRITDIMFQDLAHEPGSGPKLTALAALQAAIKDARTAALPQLSLNPE